jgi:hypothetical protein
MSSRKRGFAPGENDDGVSYLMYLFKDLEALPGIQFPGVGAALGTGPAVHAVEVAFAGEFPGHEAKLRTGSRGFVRMTGAVRMAFSFHL